MPDQVGSGAELRQLSEPDQPEERLAALEARVARLAATVERLQAQLGVEAAQDEPSAPAGVTASAGALPSAAGGPSVRRVPVSALAGRTCLVLGGAFLLRALSESGRVPYALGMVMGLVYAAAWHVLAWRDASRGRRTSALFYGLGAFAVGCPLIWEVTARSGALPPVAGAAVLFAFAAGGLLVAWRAELGGYAILSALAGNLTAVVLVFQAPGPFGYALAASAIAVATLGLGGRAALEGSRWAAALPADLALALLILWASPAYARAAPTAAAALAIGMMAVTLGVFIARVLRGREVDGFEVVQGLLILGIGFHGGAAAAGSATAGALLGALGTLLAIPAIVGVVRLAPRAGTDAAAPRGSVGYLALLAAVLLVEGLGRALPRPLAAVAWAALSVVVIHMARRPGLRMMRDVGALLGLAAAASGLAIAALQALLGDEAGPWHAVTWSEVCVLVLCAAAYAVRIRQPEEPRTRHALTDLLLLALPAVGLGGVLVALLAGPAASAPGAAADAAVLGVIRTAAIAAAAVLLALVGRGSARRELRWLSVCLLVGGAPVVGLQLLGHGTPATLFASLALYGTALSVIPRLLRAPE